MIVDTPKPPYYAVVFTSVLCKDVDGYVDEAAIMYELAKKQPGFLGMESARNALGISVSYWMSLEAIKSWSENARHKMAKRRGKEAFYESFKTRICKVEREY